MTAANTSRIPKPARTTISLNCNKTFKEMSAPPESVTAVGADYKSCKAYACPDASGRNNRRIVAALYVDADKAKGSCHFYQYRESPNFNWLASAR